jgi:hypothetical protein
LEERLAEDNTSTAEISESQEKVMPIYQNPEEILINSSPTKSEILEKVNEKAKKYIEDSKFFQE